MQWYIVYDPFGPVIQYIISCFIAACVDGEMEIVSSSTRNKLSGRVELCVNGKWGTICSSGVGDKEARVICQQMGYSPYGIYYTS